MLNRGSGRVCRETFRPKENVRDWPKADMRERLTFGSMEVLARVMRTDGDVPVKISERRLRGSSAGIHVWLFFQPADMSARPWQS